jgi:POT family proton-dependent oligopeptide transporter
MYYIWVNAGAFFRDYVLYIGEKNFLGWGFGLAGVLCCSECYSFFTQDIFGDIGLKPTAASKQNQEEKLQRILL